MRKFFSEQIARKFVAVALAASFILGPGVLGVSGIALETGGPLGSFVGWMISAILIMPMVFIFYRMGLKEASVAGIGRYVEQSLGGWAGLSVNLLFFTASLLTTPLIIKVALDYAGQLLPSQYVDGYLLGSVAILVGCLLNVRGTKWLGWTTGAAFFTISIFLLCFLFYYLDYASASLVYTAQELTKGRIGSLELVGKVTGIVFFAFIGFENLPILGGELRSKNTFILSYSFVTVVYLALALVVAGASLLHPEMSTNGLLGLISMLPGQKIISAILLIVLIVNASSTICSANRLLLTNSESVGLIKLRGEKRKALFNRLGLLGLFLFYCNLFNLIETGKIDLSAIVLLINQLVVIAYLLVVGSFLVSERGFAKWVVSVVGFGACFFMIWHSQGGFVLPVLLVILAILIRKYQKTSRPKAELKRPHLLVR